MKTLNIAIVGTKFMGRAHSNAWKKAPSFFPLQMEPVLKVACGRDQHSLQEFADNWGWEEIETDWKKLVQRKDIDVIDIAVPQHMHFEIAVAAAKEGKHLFCEKPMCMNSVQATEMLEVCNKNKVVHYLNHNYRRNPAIALAKKMISDGLLGKLYHWRSAYQQDWIISPEFPLTWQLQKETAQAGPQWDLNSHSVDLAHYLIGDIKSVSCLTTQFIAERPLADESTVNNLKAKTKGSVTAPVTVEDAALMMVQFANGAIGSFEATRFATGRRNHNTFEIYGSRGSLLFNQERMNELQYYSQDDPEGLQGFRTILATDATHPYMKHWWPVGHNLGYEHSFVHAVADFISAISEGKEIEPNFTDGVKIIKVLEAGIQSAKTGQTVKL